MEKKLWEIKAVMKNDKEYLIGALVIVEMDCPPLLCMIASYSTLNIAMLRQITFIKSLNP